MFFYIILNVWYGLNKIGIYVYCYYLVFIFKNMKIGSLIRIKIDMGVNYYG